MEQNLRIVSRAFDMISKYGISSVTMDMIAKECGISKRTLYEHFEDKNSLIIGALRYNSDSYEQEVEACIASAPEAMTAMLTIHSIVMRRLVDISQAFFIDMRRLYPQVGEAFREITERYLLRIASLIDRGKKECVFREEVDSEMIAYITQNYGSANDDVNYSSKHFLCYELFDTLFSCLMRGIATEKGLRIINEFGNKDNNQIKQI